MPYVVSEVSEVCSLWYHSDKRKTLVGGMVELYVRGSCLNYNL